MRILSTLLVLAFCMASAPAQLLPQRFGDTAPNPATSGEDLKIVYVNPAQAGNTIIIRIYNSNDSKQGQDIEIQIDPSGRGEHVLTCPEWASVVVTHPSSADLTVPVIPGDKLPGPPRLRLSLAELAP